MENSQEILKFLKMIRAILFVKFCLICTRDGINSYSDYINCIAFGEIANAICRKGEKDTAYHIEGNIRTNSYEKKW